MLTRTLIALNVALASGWATCKFPVIDWITVDQGEGKSATQKVAGVAKNAYIAGYAGGTTKLTSSEGTTATTVSTDTEDTTNLDMYIAEIKDDGKPLQQWNFVGAGLGSAPGWNFLHGMEDGNLAIGFNQKPNANLTTPAGVGDHSETLLVNKHSVGMATFIKWDHTDKEIVWIKQFEAEAGTSASSADGDHDGNMYILYSSCVPCTDEATCVPEINAYSGRPTGAFEPTCKRFISKRDKDDGSELYEVELPAGLTLGSIRLTRTGGAATDMWGWGSVTGEVDLGGAAGTVTSANSGEDGSAILIKFDATDGSAVWGSMPGGATNSISYGYMDVSDKEDDPVIAVHGSFSGTKTIGSTELTASHGSYTSFIAVLSADDGSVTWVDQVPMCRGVQVTPDNAHVGVFSQTTGSTDVVELTDADGVTTTLRSRGSWDLIAIRFAAADGVGEYAIDGGGDSMEYFHGFGMNSDGDMLISGYSRSSTFHFGTTEIESTTTDKLNKIFTIQVSADVEDPTCLASCADDTPVPKADTCFIDNYCYAEGDFSIYPANGCYKCEVATSQTEWTGPDTTAHCFIDDICYADGDMKPGSGYSPASTCQTCDVATSTSAWTIKPFYDLVDGSCVKLSEIELPDEPSAALTAAMAASTKVTEFTGDDGLKTDWAAGKTIYQGSELETLAKKSWAGTADFDLFAAYYGSATWLDDYMLTALDATGQFEGDLAPDTRGPMTEARTEAAKKCAQDQILVMAMISSVATDKMSDDNWNLAYAYWHGDTNSGAPYARANKRCKNYGTCAADGTTAKANFAVLKAIADGKAAVADEDAEAADTAFTAMRSAAYGVYYQAALRYSFKMDSAIAAEGATADYQGEGGAFWRVIAPIVDAMDPLVSPYVNDFYTMTNNPTCKSCRYCTTLYLLSNNFPSGYTATDMGTLEATDAVVCMAGVELTQDGVAADDARAANYLASSKVKEITGDDGIKTGFPEAKALYVGSILQTLTSAGAGTADVGLYSSYFGSETWLDDYMLSALDATGQFAGTLDESRGDMIDARTEAVKKGVQDQILVNAALAELAKITAESTKSDWLSFYVLWTGADPSGAPWARANKRCKNYGTCGGGTSGGNGEKAIVNSKILMIMIEAMADPAAAFAHVADVKGLCQIVYYQASLRYAFKMDNAIADGLATADYQGEGGAFWRVVAPLFYLADPATTVFVDSFYRMTTPPTGSARYCPLKTLLETNLPAGMTAADMGTLEGTADTVCDVFVAADDALVTSIVIIAPGVPADYDADIIAGAASSSLGVSPAQVTVTIGSARRHRRLQAGVTITISVTTNGGEAVATGMETAMTATFGSAAAASTFLSAATGTTIVVATDPAPASSGAAEDDEGLSTGALVGIIVGAILGVLVIGGALYFFTKGKKAPAAKGASA